ncbi:MAG TPA: hypothetical protein VKV26_01275 [Dehalococcoidia bacterium]|nr:hypothetical protein [Dehalococcoidia bacterium]
MSQEAELRLLAHLLLDWIASRSGRKLTLLPARADAIARAGDEDDRLSIVLASLSSAERPPAWVAALERFAGRLDTSGSGVLIWLPPGATVPDEEPAASTVAMAVQQAVMATPAGESRDALLPIRISLLKRDEQGAYVSAAGGLAPLWAQFTDRVQGYFQIDSTALHRLPEDEAQTRAVIDRIVAASTGMALGEARVVEAEDRWRIQRLRGGDGCAVIGLPPGDESESGAPLRRRLRAALREAGERLAGENATLRVLALYGHYPTLEMEQAGPALRGQDPALFAGLDLIVLIADGAVKPLLDITRRPLVQPRATAG